ncbi:hypothetical protein KNT64_gp029 [Pseudomonas phage PspYZU05]|uniref:Uncharacterized protein n=1 Tax=Pseudomonas phage PspYZU05 TaxID=1983556 RepID=A0A2U7NEZ6_9CAUD|nr:hypothetical protein KNT64_gp029 [Pseudomonas phage PspYZU05]ASD51981.1 hypothetical protein PspYZU05_29 [Pseudomonas phage PspYZU05]
MNAVLEIYAVGQGHRLLDQRNIVFDFDIIQKELEEIEQSGDYDGFDDTYQVDLLVVDGKDLYKGTIIELKTLFDEFQYKMDLSKKIREVFGQESVSIKNCYDLYITINGHYFFLVYRDNEEQVYLNHIHRVNGLFNRNGKYSKTLYKSQIVEYLLTLI